MIEPEEMYSDLQSTYDAFMDELRNDPSSYEDERRADPDFEALTPPEARDGSVWAPQSVSTSTTNPERPRTLTAGYDPKNFILTVQFRDNTLWNYYDVNPAVWDEFRGSPSKHEVITQGSLSTWDADKMGPAGASTRQKAAYKGLGNISSRQQKKSHVGGVSRQSTFGAKF
jgi:hypothetical protein